MTGTVQTQERGGAAPPELSTRFNAAIHCRLQRPEWLRNGCTGAVQKECSPPKLPAAHDTQLQTQYGMTGTAETQERGGAGEAQPPLNCLAHLNAALHCKDQAAISEMVEQEQWGAEGAQPPLNCSHYIEYNFNARCSAGSAPFSVIHRITPTCFAKCKSDVDAASSSKTSNTL